METQYVYVKTRAEFGKQCIFDTYGPVLDEVIKPNPEDTAHYTLRTPIHTGVQMSKQYALHEAQTLGTTTRNSGMYHYEGGWPKEMNPRDDEATARFRRRIEKDDEWVHKLRPLLKTMESNILQNSAINIHQHYFEDMIPTELIKHRGIRTVNVYDDAERIARPVNDISWSPDFGNKMVISYCSLEPGAMDDVNKTVYIWQIDNPNTPNMALEAFCPTVVTEFNPRDPSLLVSGLMSGQVCSWDTRTSKSPVQMSPRHLSHRQPVNGIKWIISKTNTEFFSCSSDGRAMWWDTRSLREPTEVLIFDLQNPNDPHLERAVGASALNFEPSVSTKFMFGLESGEVISGSRKAKSAAEKLGLRFDTHYGPVVSVDRNVFNPKVFLTTGDWTARIWSEEVKESSFLTTKFLFAQPTGGCWNKIRHSIFYLITSDGVLQTWDLLEGLEEPILVNRLCEHRLTAIAPQDEGGLIAVGSVAGKVYLVEPTESLQMFDRNDRNELVAYVDRCSRFSKAIDVRLKEMKIAKTVVVEDEPQPKLGDKKKKKPKDKAAAPAERDKQDKTKEKKRSLTKDKRKLKDELPELLICETKYFDVIEKEKEKYELEDDIAIKQSTHSAMGMKKEKKDETSKTTPPDERATKRKKERKPKPRKPSEREEVIELDLETEMLEHQKALGETTKEDSWKIKRKRSRKKEVRQPVKKAPKLPRPCKPKEVCKPKVCCFYSDFRARREKELKKMRMRRQLGMTEGKIKLEQRKRKDESSGTVSPKSPVTKDYSPKEIKMEKVPALREMMALHTELTRDVEKAKKELHEALGVTKKKKRKRKPKTKPKVPRPRRSSSDEIKETEKEMHKDATGKKVHRPTKEDKPKEKKPAVTKDPCTPATSARLVKQIETMLDDFHGISSDVQMVDEGVARQKELEAAHRRVYPRISEFHSAE